MKGHHLYSGTCPGNLSKKLWTTKSRKLKILRLNNTVQINKVTETQAEVHTTEPQHKHDATIITYIPTEKDGNCFFRCISKYLYNTEEKHEELRQNIVCKMNEDRTFYSSLVDEDLDTHLQNMKRSDGHTNTWATEAEIIAASENLKLYIL